MSRTRAAGRARGPVRRRSGRRGPARPAAGTRRPGADRRRTRPRSGSTRPRSRSRAEPVGGSGPVPPPGSRTRSRRSATGTDSSGAPSFSTNSVYEPGSRRAGPGADHPRRELHAAAGHGVAHDRGRPARTRRARLEAQVRPVVAEHLHVGVAGLDAALDAALGQLVRVHDRGRLADRRLRHGVGGAARVVRVARADRGDPVGVAAAGVDRVLPELDRERRERIRPGLRVLLQARRAGRDLDRVHGASSRYPRRCSPRGSRGRGSRTPAPPTGICVGWLIWVKPPPACTASKMRARRPGADAAARGCRSRPARRPGRCGGRRSAGWRGCSRGRGR